MFSKWCALRALSALSLQGVAYMENAFSRCSPYKWSDQGPPGAVIPAEKIKEEYNDGKRTSKTVH